MSILRDPKVTIRAKVKELSGRPKPFQVTWRVNGTEKTQTFATLADADDFKRKLDGAKVAGSPFDSETLLPTHLSKTSREKLSCLEWAKTIVADEWSTLAPTSNRGIIEGLATTLPGLVPAQVFAVTQSMNVPERERQRSILERALKKELHPDAPTMDTVEAVALGRFKRQVITLDRVTYSEVAQARQLADTNLDGVTPAAQSTRARKHQALSKLFTRAVARKLLDEHPYTQLTTAERRRSRSNAQRNNTQVTSLADAESLVSYTTHGPSRRVFELMLFAGLRPSEAHGLQAGDVVVDIDGRVSLNIQRSMSEAHSGFAKSGGHHDVRGLKWRAEGDGRVVALSTEFGARVREWARDCEPTARLCSTSTGKPVSTTNLSRAFKAARAQWVASKDVGSRPADSVLARPYDLRHVCATTLVAKMPPAEAAAHLGNGVPTLLGTYLRPIEGRQRETGTLLDSLFDKK